MVTSPASATEDSTAGGIAALLPSWRRSLAARRVSPRTIATYRTSAEQLAAYLAAKGMPATLASVRREHVEAFIADLLATKAPATAHNRFRGCQAFFAWCVEEGEIRESPMARMRPPRLQEAPPPVLRERELRAILAACERDRCSSATATPLPSGCSSTLASGAASCSGSTSLTSTWTRVS